MSVVPSASRRLGDARDRLHDATRAARLTGLAAREALYRRARRRRRAMRTGLIVVALVVAVLTVTGVVLAVRLAADAGAAARRTDVLAASRDAVASMLSANPEHAAQYADSLIAASTGEQHARLIAARSELITEIGRQPEPSTGVIVSAGLVTDPGDAPDATARVLLIAEATNPALIGGDPSQKRMPIVVTMRLVGERWKVEKAGLE